MLLNKNKKFKASTKSWISFEKKIHKLIQLKQKAWLKSYIDINTELRKKKTKNDLKMTFKLVNDSVFVKQ